MSAATVRGAAIGVLAAEVCLLVLAGVVGVVEHEHHTGAVPPRVLDSQCIDGTISQGIAYTGNGGDRLAVDTGVSC